MIAIPYSREQWVAVAKFSGNDLAVIKQCRLDYTRLGFGYQLAFVRLFNSFPIQEPFESQDEIVAFVSHQLGIAEQSLSHYVKRQPTYPSIRR
jgi:hypothetical protein